MPPTSPDTHTALLDAAEALFSAHGYDAVGIRDIAARAQANVAAIKYHFGSKRDLYLQTVSRAMSQADGTSAWGVLHDHDLPDDKLDAAVLLVQFMHAFLTQLLPAKGIDPCGTLIIREGMQPSEALDSVVDHYLEPNQTVMVKLLHILRPDLTTDTLARDAQCILGQLVHYRVFRAIIERLHGHSLADPARIKILTEHIARFSLRGLCFDDSFIDSALTRALTGTPTSTQGFSL